MGAVCYRFYKKQLIFTEGSVFEGQVKYDGEKFYRQGFGTQDFTNSSLYVDCPIGMLAKTFIGSYDTEGGYPWMYGNGVLYCVDEVTKTPAGFVKGFFNTLSFITDWHGDFDYNSLLSGYVKDMEVKIVPFEKRRIYLQQTYKDKTCDYLFVGDSWVEMWQDPIRYGIDVFARDTAGLDAINVGIGGSKFSDWLSWIDDLVISRKPKYIFVNLGSNDIHHNQSVDFVYNCMVEFINNVKSKLPDVKFYCTSNVLCSPFADCFDKARELNRLKKDFCDKNSDFCKFINTYKLFTVNDQIIKNWDDLCIDDNLHFNLTGYNIWSTFVTDFIKNNKF